MSSPMARSIRASSRMERVTEWYDRRPAVAAAAAGRVSYLSLSLTHTLSTHVQGVHESKDGSKYEGEFRSGKKNGRGVYIYADGSMYEGEFVNDNFHGKGKYVFADGETYEGDFKDDVFCGSGVYHFAEGDVYSGEYVGDIMHGKGTVSLVLSLSLALACARSLCFMWLIARFA